MFSGIFIWFPTRQFHILCRHVASSPGILVALVATSQNATLGERTHTWLVDRKNKEVTEIMEQKWGKARRSKEMIDGEEEEVGSHDR